MPDRHTEKEGEECGEEKWRCGTDRIKGKKKAPCKKDKLDFKAGILPVCAPVPA